VGFAGDDDARFPYRKFYILRKSYAVVLFGRAVTLAPENEHFFKVNGFQFRKAGGFFDFGIKLLGKEPSLIIAAFPGSETIPMPRGWIDFRDRKGKNN
jgi:hypothetical protein